MINVDILCEFSAALMGALVVVLVDCSHTFLTSMLRWAGIGRGRCFLSITNRCSCCWLGETRLFLLEKFKFSDEVKFLHRSNARTITLRHNFILIASFHWLWLSFCFNLLFVVVIASEPLSKSAQFDAKRRLLCGMICFLIQHWKFLSLQFVEITHMRDAKFWWLLVKIWTSNIGVCREVAKIGIRSFHAR